MNLLDVIDASVVMRQGRSRFTALAPTSLSLATGESLAVTGRSGAGKSTLANLILGLIEPETGSVKLQGKTWVDSHTLPNRSQRHLVQSVPQDAQASFVPRWTIGRSLQHVAKRLRPEADSESLISRAVQLANFDQGLLGRRPHQVSGGQAQRAAIARALVAEPALIVADEPTSALDAVTAESVMKSLISLTRTTETALLVVTHDPVFAALCDRQINLTGATASRT